MSKTYIPAHYHTPLNVYEMQRAIEFIKSNFQVNLSNALNLRRVSAPLFVEENSGLNDNLNGVERPVSFDIPDVGHNAQVVQSLAKWKRLALKRYEFNVGKGLFTDMNAIRRDEEVDNLHSIYVDQWDWEKVIDAGDRNVSYLKRTVRDIVGAIVETNDALGIAFPSLHTKLSRDVFFITTQELEDKYPDLTPKQREDAICREHGTVFLMQIGLTLHSGIKHDAARPTTTTGRSTVICCSGTTSWAARLRSPPWASASAPSPSTTSSPSPAATTAGSFPSTRCCSPASCPSPWAAASVRAVFVC